MMSQEVEDVTKSGNFPLGGSISALPWRHETQLDVWIALHALSGLFLTTGG